MARTQQQELLWGTDGIVSLPKALETPHANMIDMSGFVMTPTGLRLNITDVDREELLRSGYGPRKSDGPVYE